MSDLAKLLETLSAKISAKEQHYVYYNPKTLKIHRISPIEQNDEIYSSFLIDSNFVEPILNGYKKIDDFLVCYDYSKKDYSIRPRSEQHFSNLYLTIINEDIPNSDLSIEIDTKIKFRLDNSLRKHIKQDTTNLIFVITESSNPYKIYQSFNFPANLLDSDSGVHAELKYPIENFQNGVSIYTNKVFDTYSVKVKDDTKVSTN